MVIKQLEIRDQATCMPMLAIEVTGKDGWLMWRAGFGVIPCIIFINLCKMECQYDPYSWNTSARTVPIAHEWIRTHWEEIQNEDVIDVEFLLGEKPTKKISERTPEWHF